MTTENSELVIQIAAMPADTNANGDIFGGWLVANMDMGGAIAARRVAKCRVVTVAIDQMIFKKPVYVGDTVCCYATLTHVGNTSLQFKIEVFTIGIAASDRKPVAEGVFTFVAIDDDGKPQPVKRT